VVGRADEAGLPHAPGVEDAEAKVDGGAGKRDDPRLERDALGLITNAEFPVRVEGERLTNSNNSRIAATKQDKIPMSKRCWHH
jgi:hypothetical protein